MADEGRSTSWPCCQHWCDCWGEDKPPNQHDRPCQQDGCQVDDPDAYLTTPASTPSPTVTKDGTA